MKKSFINNDGRNPILGRISKQGLHQLMNESSIRYNVNAKWMRLLATLALDEKRFFLKKVKDGVCRQSSAYTYGENHQFNRKI